jgi:hypothetical protein
MNERAVTFPFKNVLQSIQNPPLAGSKESRTASIAPPAQRRSSVDVKTRTKVAVSQMFRRRSGRFAVDKRR